MVPKEVEEENKKEKKRVRKNRILKKVRSLNKRKEKLNR